MFPGKHTKHNIKTDLVYFTSPSKKYTSSCACVLISVIIDDNAFEQILMPYKSFVPTQSGTCLRLINYIWQNAMNRPSKQHVSRMWPRLCGVFLEWQWHVKPKRRKKTAYQTVCMLAKSCQGSVSARLDHHFMSTNLCKMQRVSRCHPGMLHIYHDCNHSYLQSSCCDLLHSCFDHIPSTKLI